MKTGRYFMERGWQDHALFAGDAYSRRDAWEWLIAEARYEPGQISINGKMVTLQRGELSHSVRFMAEKWGWTKSTVARFIERLKKEGMLETQASCGVYEGRSETDTATGTASGTGQLVITICNYAKYQAKPKKGGTATGTDSGTAAGQQRDKEEEGKEGKEIDHRALGLEGFEWIPLAEWRAFEDMRNRKRKPMTDFARQLILKSLTEFQKGGDDPKAVLERSIRNGWTDVFPLGQSAGAKPKKVTAQTYKGGF